MGAGASIPTPDGGWQTEDQARAAGATEEQIAAYKRSLSVAPVLVARRSDGTVICPTGDALIRVPDG